MYLWDALTPVVFYVMLMISLALANLLWHVALNKAPVSPSSEAHTSLLSESEGEAAMEFAADKVRVHIEAPKFSAWYFVVSEALGVLNFWNFGVTLSSLAFWSQQTQTGTNFQYIEALPWILYEDGWTLRKPSLPFLILITAGTPISWVLLFTRFRNEIGTTHVTNLIGGLYHTYRQPVFYWEFVVLVRRLLIAALVRLPATNVFRHWMVVVVLLVALVLQYRFHPLQRRRGELDRSDRAVRRPSFFLHSTVPYAYPLARHCTGLDMHRDQCSVLLRLL